MDSLWFLDFVEFKINNGNCSGKNNWANHPVVNPADICAITIVDLFLLYFVY